MYVHIHIHVHGIQANQIPNKHKEIKQTKQNHTKKETQTQKKQLKQRLKHVSKTKGKQVERIRLFWARI